MLYLGDLELNKVYGFISSTGADDFVKFDGETVYTGMVKGNSLNVTYLDKAMRLKDVKHLLAQAEELGYTVVKG